MEHPQELLGDVALALNPRALRFREGSTRVRVALRGDLGAAELCAFLGDDARLVEGPGQVRIAEFDARFLARAAPPSPRMGALLAAARERRRPAAPPRLLGVLNVTPDSFSDGGLWNDPARALEHALELVDQGADAIDVGGESSRPGAPAVDLEEERRRVLPVVRELARRLAVPISVDTTKARLAEEALDLGAGIVNDISAGRFDPGMLPLVARRECGFVLMHMQGTPADMQRAPAYGEVVDEVLAFLRERASLCWRSGIAPERLWVDPGIGFGKSLEHNLELIARLDELRSLGLPVLVGPSRKSFLAGLDPRAGDPARGRLGGTAAAVAACVQAGAAWLRVHDVREMGEAARVAWALARR